MAERPCSKCIWQSVDGCTSWDCEPVLRSEIRALLASYGSIDNIKPVVHGEWKQIHKGTDFLHWATCSVCGERQQLECMNYCPHCGADMGVMLDDS